MPKAQPQKSRPRKQKAATISAQTVESRAAGEGEIDSGESTMVAKPDLVRTIVEAVRASGYYDPRLYNELKPTPKLSTFEGVLAQPILEPFPFAIYHDLQDIDEPDRGRYALKVAERFVARKLEERIRALAQIYEVDLEAPCAIFALFLKLARDVAPGFEVTPQPSAQKTRSRGRPKGTTKHDFGRLYWMFISFARNLVCRCVRLACI
jgi:hypothetical protein